MVRGKKHAVQYQSQVFGLTKKKTDGALRAMAAEERISEALDRRPSKKKGDL